MRKGRAFSAVDRQDLGQVALIHQVLHCCLNRRGELLIGFRNGDTLGSRLDYVADLLDLAAGLDRSKPDYGCVRKCRVILAAHNLGGDV